MNFLICSFEYSRENSAEIPLSIYSQKLFMFKSHFRISYSSDFIFHQQGKGEMETFWLEEGPDDNSSHRRRSGSGMKDKLKTMFNGN